jgi:peptidyl-prolyl cis-trans isomerase C
MMNRSVSALTGLPMNLCRSLSRNLGRIETLTIPIPAALSASALLLALPLTQAAQNSNLFDKPAPGSTAQLFGDTVVAKGTGFEIKQSQVDQMYLAFKGHRAAMGEAVPDDMRPRIESDILDKLIATHLFVMRATEADKASAKKIADDFLADQKKAALSEDSYRRQLLAVGMTPQEFDAQIREQAIVKAVIDREIKAKKTVTDAEAHAFYTNNPSVFREPELVRAAHVLISTHDNLTGKPLTPEAKLEKRQLAAKIAARAKAGEDFAKLVKEFSQDTHSLDRNGEYTFARAKDDPRRAMTPEFEAAAFSMQPGQVSDIVETSYGYHIIKTLEKIPSKVIDYAQVETRIKESLLRESVEKDLPGYIEKLRKEAGVQILLSQANTKP